MTQTPLFLYFVIDTSTVADVEAGQEYDVTFSVNENYAYADDDESSETNFSIVERTSELTGEFDDEDRLQVGNEAEATISGESSAAPGTDVQVRLRATGEDPFLMSQTVEVQDDGTFEAVFDLSDNKVGQEFSISVTDMEEDATGVIVESSGNQQPGSPADEQPGFGIAVALIALLAAAGIALRRHKSINHPDRPDPAVADFLSTRPSSNGHAHL